MKTKQTGVYWISPTGNILTGFRWHSEKVLEKPEIFGLTDKQVDEIYKKYDEPKFDGSPSFPPTPYLGYAQGELLEKVIKNEWISINYYSNINKYIVELNELSSAAKDYLKIWAKGILKKNQNQQYSEVSITTLDFGLDTPNYWFEEPPAKVFYSEKEWERTTRYYLVPIKDVYEFSTLAPRIRYRVYIHKRLEMEKELGRRLNDTELDDLRNTLEFPDDYVFTLGDVAGWVVK